jgi:DNA-binding beta-propeller fold protein YncE
MDRKVHWMKFLAVAALYASFGLEPGAQERHQSAADAAQPPTLVWPSPPLPAAIRFVTTLPPLQVESGGKSLFRSLGKVLSSSSPKQMLRPVGIAAAGGTLFLTDPGGHALLVYDLERHSLQAIYKAGDQPLESPIGIAGGRDRIFVSDSSLRKIFVYDRRGRFLKTFAAEQLVRPTGLAFDEKSRRLYVVDTGAHQIHVYRDDGTLEQSLGQRGAGKGEFNYPTHLWVDRDGSLLVVDSLNYRVQMFRADGSFAAAFGRQGDSSGEFASPKGVATDSRGHVYVVDALFDSVQIFDRNGELLLTFGERGTGKGQFWLPSGIFIDGNDRIYVADSYNQRIQVFEFLGVPAHE